MAKYISLVKYTAKGIENIKESPNRLDAFKRLCESMGATLDGFYLTMGQYDIVTIVDAPDPETVAKILLTATSGGGYKLRNPSSLYRSGISESNIRATID